jgi:hypothetical protein
LGIKFGAILTLLLAAKFRPRSVTTRGDRMNQVAINIKPKKNPQGPFEFKRCDIVGAAPGSLLISPMGGPFCLVTVEMYNAQDEYMGGTANVGNGDPWSSLENGRVEWPIDASRCQGGILKWMIVPVLGAGALLPYVMTAQVRQGGILLGEARYKGSIDVGGTVGDAIIDGVNIV